jgi:hypothetical protein
MPPRLFCNVVYSWLTRNATAEDKETFDNDLYSDPARGDDLSRFLMNLEGAGD